MALHRRNLVIVAGLVDRKELSRYFSSESDFLDLQGDIHRALREPSITPLISPLAFLAERKSDSHIKLPKRGLDFQNKVAKVSIEELVRNWTVFSEYGPAIPQHSFVSMAVEDFAKVLASQKFSEYEAAQLLLGKPRSNLEAVFHSQLVSLCRDAQILRIRGPIPELGSVNVDEKLAGLRLENVVNPDIRHTLVIDDYIRDPLRVLQIMGEDLKFIRFSSLGNSYGRKLQGKLELSTSEYRILQQLPGFRRFCQESGMNPNTLRSKLAHEFFVNFVIESVKVRKLISASKAQKLLVGDVATYSTLATLSQTRQQGLDCVLLPHTSLSSSYQLASSFQFEAMEHLSSRAHSPDLYSSRMLSRVKTFDYFPEENRHQRPKSVFSRKSVLLLSFAIDSAKALRYEFVGAGNRAIGDFVLKLAKGLATTLFKKENHLLLIGDWQFDTYLWNSDLSSFQAILEALKQDFSFIKGQRVIVKLKPGHIHTSHMSSLSNLPANISFVVGDMKFFERSEFKVLELEPTVSTIKLRKLGFDVIGLKARTHWGRFDSYVKNE